MKDIGEKGMGAVFIKHMVFKAHPNHPEYSNKN